MFGNYVNGEWINTGATFEDRNPANTAEVVGTFVKGSAADIDAAAAAALAAFPAGAPPADRRAAIFSLRPPTSWIKTSNPSPPI